MKTFNKTFLISISFLFAGTCHSVKADEHIDENSDSAILTGTSESKTLLEKAEEKMPDWMKDVADRIQLHGYAQGGYTYRHQDGRNTNSFEIYRVLFWANAQITPRWSFLFMHDFSSVVQEYYTDFRVTRNKALTVRFGQFKHGYSYENPLSPTSMETIDVYSDGVVYLAGCGSDPLYGVQYGRDLGAAIYGNLFKDKFRYEFDVLNGQGINSRDRNNKKDMILRLEYKPVKGLNLVATGQLGRGNALVGGTILNPTLQAGENYLRNRWSVGFDYKSEPINVHGEYLEGKDGSVVSRGAYITSVVPIYKGLEGVASYDYFNYNTKQGYDQHRVVAGLQYWFFRKCRFQINYVYKNSITNYRTFFHHGANNAIMCQMQVRFN